MQKDVIAKVASERFGDALKHIHIPDNPPYLVLVAGPCRVGTTALANVFARLGIVSYMQPIKSMRRAIEEGEPIIDWNIEEGRVALSKETLGSKTESEFFDPVAILLDAGYPKDKISLIAIMREPERTLTSWTWMWDEISMAGFIRAYTGTSKMAELAEKNDISITYYVHEAIRDNSPYLVVNNLTRRVMPVAMNISEESVDWSKGNNFDMARQVRFFDTPPDRFVHAVRTWGGYKYRELVPDLTADQMRILGNGGIYGIYDKFRKRCEQDLGISISRNMDVLKTAELETIDTDS